MDKLIYCNDLEQLKTKLTENGYYDEESNSFTVNNTLTPLKYEGNTSLSYVRNCVLDLEVFTMLEDLGDYDEMFANEDSHSKYKSVYPYDVPVVYTDEDGTEKEYMRPEKIGVFF